MATSFLVFAINIYFVVGESHATAEPVNQLETATIKNPSTTNEISKNYLDADFISTHQYLLVDRIITIINKSGGNFVAQKVKPGQTQPDDYVVYGHVSTKNRLKDNTSTTNPSHSSEGQFIKPNKIWSEHIVSNLTSNKPLMNQSISPIQNNNNVTKLYLPSPHRPSFAGQTGGYYVQQLIKPGKPWPERPEDYDNFSVTTKKPTSTLNLPNFLTTVPTYSSSQNGVDGSHKPFVPKPNQNNGIEDRFEEVVTGTHVQNGSTWSNSPSPSRPSFAGLTGGHQVQQLIKPGKPWPAKPEDYGDFSVTTKKPLSHFYDKPKYPLNNLSLTTPIRPYRFSQNEGDGSHNSSAFELYTNTELPLKDTFGETVNKTNSVSLILPGPNRPSFAGQTGGGVLTQSIKPGQPWPFQHAQNHMECPTTIKPHLDDRFEEVQTDNNSQNVSTLPNSSNPNIPSFAEQTGGGVPSQSIKPGKPWPSQPPDNHMENSTSKTPLDDRFEEALTDNHSQNGSTLSNLSNPSRPSFAGQTGGGVPSQSIKSGKPWPSKPEATIRK